jgi:hypothetical protein
MYKVVLVREEYIDFIEQYPDVLKQLLIEEKSMFDSKQLQLIFENTKLMIQYLEDDMFHRSHYQYVHGIHKITNEITNETLTFVINNYDIEVNENNDKHIVYDYLRHYSQNFYMFDI